MHTSTGLAAIFHAHAPGRVDAPGNDATLEELLGRTVAAGRERWPHLALSAEDFVGHLARQLPEVAPEVPLSLVLKGLHVDDLYLACACLRGVPEALPTLEQQCLEKLHKPLTPYASVRDDVLQDLRVHLLMGTLRSGPQLSSYRGRASLSNWLRVIAVRMAMQRAGPVPERQEEEEEVLEALAALPAPGADLELNLIRHRCQREFHQALRAAFASLSCEQRDLLRLYYLERLTTTELGQRLRVTQPTASRRLAAAREAVYEETRRRLQEHLRLASR
jgi:RNA polymerase sigma-70 factor